MRRGSVWTIKKGKDGEGEFPISGAIGREKTRGGEGRLVAVTSHSYNERGRLTKLFRQADIQTHLHSADRELPLAKPPPTTLV